MQTSYRIAALVTAAAWFCPKAYAPLFGEYPGLHSLIEKSEIIAAATILDQLPEWDIGGSKRYKVEFTKVFKGNPPHKQAIAWLRNLEISTPVGLLSGREFFAPAELPGSEFKSRARYVLFLVKSERDDKTPYENVNCEGSSFPISPLCDLASLKVESLPDTLVLLFREYVDFKGEEFKEFEQQLNAFIHEGEK